MVDNMWKNSLKNVESDNKILYENLLAYLYSETVLTFWISLVLMSETCWVHKKWNKIGIDFKLVFYSSRFT